MIKAVAFVVLCFLKLHVSGTSFFDGEDVIVSSVYDGATETVILDKLHDQDDQYLLHNGFANAKTVHLKFNAFGESYEAVFHKGSSILTQNSAITGGTGSKHRMRRVIQDVVSFVSVTKTSALTFINDNTIRGVVQQNGHVVSFQSSHSYGENDYVKVHFGINLLQGACGSEHTNNHGRHKRITKPFKDCFPNWNITRDMNIGIAVGSAFIGNKTETQVSAELQAMITQANTIFRPQLNLILKLGELFLPTVSNNEAWDPGPSCDLYYKTMFSNFRKWRAPSNQAVWMLIDDCFERNSESGKTAGIANLDELCEQGTWFGEYRNRGLIFTTEATTYLTLMHEIGHIIGAIHVSDGIMAQGLRNKPHDGVIQFSPDSKNRICTGVTNALAANCPHMPTSVFECHSIESTSCCVVNHGGRKVGIPDLSQCN
eukprot:m.41771 g.41771  ORF g.41771 m.41771 type:complete len:429 (+) comp9809_c0_seq2:158-1444(+)